jgi:hypothetical protein
MPAFKRFNRRLMLPGRSRYTLFDSFSVDAAAGSVNGTFSDKSHSERTVVDTENKLSISGGKLVFAGGVGWGDPGIWYPAEARVAGKVLLGSLSFPNTTEYQGFGWALSQTGAPTQNGVQFTGIGTIVGWGGNDTFPAVALYTATSYSVAIVLRAAGAYYFIKGGVFTNWTLLWIESRGPDVAIYAGIPNASGSFTADEPHIAKRRWLPEPIAYSTFQGADGPLTVSDAVGPDGQSCISRAWSFPAGTAAISGNAAVISPTAGAELVTNGIFDHDDHWTKTAGCTIADGVMHINYVGGYTGYFNQAATVSPIGKWCRWSLKVAAVTSGRIDILPGSSGITLTLNPPLQATYGGTLRCDSDFIATNGDGAVMDVDDYSLLPLTLASLFSSVTDAKTSDVMVDVKVAALTTGTQAGLVARLDSASSPANFILCYFNGAGSVVVDECVAGVYTNIMAAVAKAFTADDTLRVSATGTALRIYHVTAAGVAVLLGTATTAVATGSRFGIFSTFVSNTFSQVQVFPIGSGAEWEALSSL